MDQYHGMQDGNINISDVIEVIQTTDPGFVECNGGETVGMISGGGVEVAKPTRGLDNVKGGNRNQPYVEIVQQPASKALRFRYECEGRSAGSIPGVNSTPENKTFPSIRVVGYKGRAIAVVSCVTKDVPYRPHPHNLVGKDVCKRGVCTVEIASENMTVTFANLGIQCVKKKDIEEALRIREEIRVDPFRTGFDHKRQPTSIDLNAVRLCFQVFLEGAEKGKFNVPLPPVVSDPIYDKKAMSDLVICKLSTCSASVAGGTEMMLFCEKVAKEDIQVRFFEERDGQLVWEGFGDFQPTHVHKQVGIAFRTPSYRMQQVDQPVQIFIQLKRPSDGSTSDPLPFQLLPLGSDDPDSLRRKRQKFNNGPGALVLKHMKAEAEKHSALLNPPVQYNFNLIKSEPVEPGSIPYVGSPYGGGIATGGTSPMYVATASPQPQTPAVMQNLRPQQTPGRTPSPMEYSPYNINLPQQQNLALQYQAQHNMQAVSPIPSMHEQQQQLPFVHQQQQRQQQQIPLNILTPEQDEAAFRQMVDPGDMEGAAGVTLDMDSQQYHFDMNVNLNLDSSDLALLDTALSENLSSGLSITDPVKKSVSVKGTDAQDASMATEVSEMTDSFTRLTRNTIQELCTLNNIYKPSRDNFG